MHIRTYKQKILISLMNHEGTRKQWFSDFDKLLFIRITSDYFMDFPIDVPEERVLYFDFYDIEEEEYIKRKKELEEWAKKQREYLDKPIVRVTPITDEEAEEIVNFVLKYKDIPDVVLYIHCDEGVSRSPSLGYAIAKYILKDELLAEYFDAPFYNMNQTIIRKIKNAYEKITGEKIKED